MKTYEIFDLSKSLAEPLLSKTEYPWEALPQIRDFILNLIPSLDKSVYEEVKPTVWIAKAQR